MWSFLVLAIMMALVTAVYPLPYWCRPRSYLVHKQGETPEIIGEKVIFLEDGQDGTRILTEEDLKQLYTCERAEARLEAANTKINELEEELRVVINNMKSLEISEQEALQREDSYEATIRDLSQRLEAAETRAAEAEGVVNKLQKEVDFLEDELLGDNLDHTFDELPGF